MKSRHVLMLSLLLPLMAACGPKPATDATPAAETPAATTTDAAPAPATDAAATPADATTATPTDGSDTDTAAAANTNPIVPPQGPAPVAGTDYVVIPNGQPYAPLNGQIEVVEVFGYVCPACARFAPEVSAWKRRQPADVRVTYVPVVFGPVWKPYAHAFYAAQSKGLVDRSHDAVFAAIHLQRTLPGEGRPPTDAATIAAWYAQQYGVDAKEFVSLMNSFGTNSQVNRGMQFARSTGVEGTPTIIVNGKYRVTGGQTYADVLRIADHLVAMERAQR